MAGRAAFALPFWSALPPDVRRTLVADLVGGWPALDGGERTKLSASLSEARDGSGEEVRAALLLAGAPGEAVAATLNSGAARRADGVSAAEVRARARQLGVIAGRGEMSIVSSLIDRYVIKMPKFRKKLTRALFGTRISDIELFGLCLTIKRDEENGYLRASRKARRLSVFRDEATVIITLASLISEGDIFLDVGANVGLFSALIQRLSRLKRGVRVIAF